MICSCVAFGTSVISPAIRLSCMTRMRSLIPNTSGSSELTSDGLALRRQLVDELVHLVLGADVDAARGLIEENDFAMAFQPLGQHHFLLVAAGEVRGALFLMLEFDPQAVEVSGASRSLRALPHEAPAAEALEIRQPENSRARTA